MVGPETGAGGLVRCFGDARSRSCRLLAKGPRAAYWSLVGAAVAQLVEQRIRNAWVGGSNPFRGTSKISVQLGLTERP
jgi:hypothetical protein